MAVWQYGRYVRYVRYARYGALVRGLGLLGNDMPWPPSSSLNARRKVTLRSSCGQSSPPVIQVHPKSIHSIPSIHSPNPAVLDRSGAAATRVEYLGTKKVHKPSFSCGYRCV